MRSSRTQRGWYVYDWANSAFQTSVITVFAGPFLTAAAEAAAGADGFVRPLGVPVRAAALYPYAVSLSALLQVLVMPVVGALADRTGRRRLQLAVTASTGAVATVLVVVADGYLAVGALFLVATVAFGCSIVVYHAHLPDIAAPDERDAVSSRGWALGYLGGGVLLALHLVLVTLAEAGALPFSQGTAVRIAIASAGCGGGRSRSCRWRCCPTRSGRRAAGGVLTAGFRQLAGTARLLAGTRATLLFLAAYLLYNDGIQTVISQSAVYADAELRLPQSVVAGAILLVQFVAVAGAYGAACRRPDTGPSGSCSPASRSGSGCWPRRSSCRPGARWRSSCWRR